MLALKDDLTPICNFAVDIIGLATRYDFTVLRWGVQEGWFCTVVLDDSVSHQQWLAVDIILADATDTQRFVTDCAIAGLFCRVKDEHIHIQALPLQVQ